MTATMISRLVLNLRSASDSPSPREVGTDDPTTTDIGIRSRTIGNLGEELDTIFETTMDYSSAFTEDISMVKTRTDRGHVVP
jgi:hypothetical protein